MAQQTLPAQPRRNLGSLAMLVGYLRPYLWRVLGASVALLTRRASCWASARGCAS